METRCQRRLFTFYLLSPAAGSADVRSKSYSPEHCTLECTLPYSKCSAISQWIDPLNIQTPAVRSVCSGQDKYRNALLSNRTTIITSSRRAKHFPSPPAHIHVHTTTLQPLLVPQLLYFFCHGNKPPPCYAPRFRNSFLPFSKTASRVVDLFLASQQ